MRMIKEFVALEELIGVEPSLNVPVLCMTYAPFSYIEYQAFPAMGKYSVEPVIAPYVDLASLVRIAVVLCLSVV